jgi:type II secretory pathway predicted ATPase ExeA
MSRLAEFLREARIAQSALAKASGISRSALQRLIGTGEYPKREPPATTRRMLRDGLRALGFTAGLDGLFVEAESVTPPCRNTAASDAATTTEVHMLITKRSLSNAAREAFSLPASALTAPTRAEEVFLGGEMRVGFEHLLAKARFGGMLALAGESGAGKTTLKDLLVTELNKAGEVIVIEPHVQAMEANDKAGKTLKAAAIVEAIMREVAPAEKLKASSEARLAQVEAALARSADADANRRHLLVIDEAHCLPIPTLKHLKRFCEFKRKGRGLQPALLTIVLLGQPELKLRLSTYDQEVREVWQRCELVTLRPLERDLAAYLKHRLGAAAARFDAGALDALKLVLTDGGKSFCYPLAIDNWLAEILNTAAKVGARQISAETVATAKKAVLKRTQEVG